MKWKYYDKMKDLNKELDKKHAIPMLRIVTFLSQNTAQRSSKEEISRRIFVVYSERIIGAIVPFEIFCCVKFVS